MTQPNRHSRDLRQQELQQIVKTLEERCRAAGCPIKAEKLPERDGQVGVRFDMTAGSSWILHRQERRKLDQWLITVQIQGTEGSIADAHAYETLTPREIDMHLEIMRRLQEKPSTRDAGDWREHQHSTIQDAVIDGWDIDEIMLDHPRKPPKVRPPVKMETITNITEVQSIINELAHNRLDGIAKRLQQAFQITGQEHGELKPRQERSHPSDSLKPETKEWYRQQLSLLPDQFDRAQAKEAWDVYDGSVIGRISILKRYKGITEREKGTYEKVKGW